MNEEIVNHKFGSHTVRLDENSLIVQTVLYTFKVYCTYSTGHHTSYTDLANLAHIVLKTEKPTQQNLHSKHGIESVKTAVILYGGDSTV
jgi:hypothetical protein